MSYRVTAFDLKLALLRYLRFERQWICVDEFRKADVATDTGREIFEIEIKVNKGDLVNKECYKKCKHYCYSRGQSYRMFHPNRFYFCVPEPLVGTAMKVCEALNPRYGVIAFNVNVLEQHIGWKWKSPHRECLRMARSAKRLHNSYASYQKAMAMRASSKIITLLENEFNRSFIGED